MQLLEIRQGGRHDALYLVEVVVLQVQMCKFLEVDVGKVEVVQGVLC